MKHLTPLSTTSFATYSPEPAIIPHAPNQVHVQSPLESKYQVALRGASNVDVDLALASNFGPERKTPSAQIEAAEPLGLFPRLFKIFAKLLGQASTNDSKIEKRFLGLGDPSTTSTTSATRSASQSTSASGSASTSASPASTTSASVSAPESTSASVSTPQSASASAPPSSTTSASVSAPESTSASASPASTTSASVSAPENTSASASHASTTSATAAPSTFATAAPSRLPTGGPTYTGSKTPSASKTSSATPTVSTSSSGTPSASASNSETPSASTSNSETPTTSLSLSTPPRLMSPTSSPTANIENCVIDGVLCNTIKLADGKILQNTEGLPIYTPADLPTYVTDQPLPIFTNSSTNISSLIDSVDYTFPLMDASSPKTQTFGYIRNGALVVMQNGGQEFSGPANLISTFTNATSHVNATSYFLGEDSALALAPENAFTSASCKWQDSPQPIITEEAPSSLSVGGASAALAVIGALAAGYAKHKVSSGRRAAMTVGAVALATGIIVGGVVGSMSSR